jgi:pimeloyl-ACP methyl ester carboxylesterase
MAIQPASSGKIELKSPLLVLLHGDNGGSMVASSYPALAAKLSEEFASPAIFMLRPGYRGDNGKSDGEAGVFDDDYTKKNVEALSFALAHLRSLSPERKLVLVGHSGGAAMAALVQSHYPQLVDAAVLAGCPCDVQTWRQWRQSSAGKRDGAWPNSLSPSDFAKQVPAKSVTVAVTGDKDTNTLAKFAQEYVAALQTNGVANARFILAAGATHGGVRQSKELFDGIRFALEKIAAPN